MSFFPRSDPPPTCPWTQKLLILIFEYFPYGDADLQNSKKHKYEDGSLEGNGDGVIENRDKH